MNEADWYEVTQGSSLLQGDILMNCPVFALAEELKWPVPPGTSLPMGAKELDLVVMTQSCDLANDKVEDLLLAQLVAWPDAVRIEVQRGNQFVKSPKFRKQLIDGNVPGLSLLHNRQQEPRLSWSIVDFHHLYTLPKAFTSQFAGSCGPRLRLRSPYREHLAQAFARYFMRVGLPHEAKAFETEGAGQL